MSAKDQIGRFDLPPGEQAQLLSAENMIKDRHLIKVQNLSMAELRAFNKHFHKKL